MGLLSHPMVTAEDPSILIFTLHLQMSELEHRLGVGRHWGQELSPRLCAYLGCVPKGHFRDKPRALSDPVGEGVLPRGNPFSTSADATSKIEEIDT